MTAVNFPPIRFGVAGVGRHGQRYASHLARGDIPGASLAGVWRRQADAGRTIAELLGTAFFPSFDALLAEADAIVLAVPSGLHAALAPRVAEAGKPLLIEKPLARTVAEGRTIVDAFAAADVPLTVAQTLRFDPLVAAASAASKDLGPLVGFGFEQRLEPRGLAWEDDPSLAGGGVVAQTGIHAIDTLRHLTKPEGVDVLHASLARVGYAVNEDHALLQLALTGCPAAQGRVIGDVRVSKIGTSRHHRYALFFGRAGLELDFIDRALIITEGRDRRVVAVPDRPTVPQLVAAFTAFVAGEAANPVPAPDALKSLMVVEAAYAS